MATKALVVTFHKVGTQRPSAWWEAVRRSGGTVTGGHMPIGRGVIPHDLAHLATEAVLQLPNGFWGLLARGATYRHGTQQRPTRTGRSLVRDHRRELREAEALGNHHHGTWVEGGSTPVGPTFDHLAQRWNELPVGGSLAVHWPGLDVPAARGKQRNRWLRACGTGVVLTLGACDDGDASPPPAAPPSTRAVPGAPGDTATVPTLDLSDRGTEYRDP